MAVTMAAAMLFEQDYRAAAAESFSLEEDSFSEEEINKEEETDEAPDESLEETGEVITDDTSVSENENDPEVEEATEAEAETEGEADAGTSEEALDLTEDETETDGEDTEAAAPGTEAVTDEKLSEKSSLLSEEKLPEGIFGMPEGYELSDAEKNMKQDALSRDLLTSLETMTEGEDYVESQVIALAGSEEEALAIADAYCGKLEDYDYGVATISLSDSGLSVYDAFKYSLDEELELPFVEPNYLSSIIEPAEEDTSLRLFSSGAGSDVPADNGFSDRWWVDNYQDPYLDPESGYYQWHHDLLNTYSAWGVTIGSHDIKVAVLDTGVNSTHVDLDDNIDLEDAVEVVKGIGYEDKIGHGTHVSGIIAAELNNQLGAGVAPGVQIIPVKVVNESKGTVPDSYVIQGIAAVSGLDSENKTYEVLPGERLADIINMSFGDGHYNALFAYAIQKSYEAGVTIVSAMGNDNGANHMNYPACYDHVIGVCSVNQSGSLSDFSTYGPWADIAAPGTGIYSTYTGGTERYYKEGGTSMASPVVAGACALYMSAVGHVDPDTMEAVLKSSVTGTVGEGTGVLDLSLLFDGDTTAPKLTLSAADEDRTLIGTVDDGDTRRAIYNISPDSILTFTALNYGGNEEGNENTRIVYTTDGKAPCVFNGNVINGTPVLSGTEITVKELMGDVQSKTTITVKAAAVTGMGLMGDVSTLIFTADPAAAVTPEAVTDNLTVTVVNAPDKLVAGKSFKLEAKVTSDDETKNVSQKVLWRIVSYSSNELSTAKINASTGTLTTKAGTRGTLEISCISADTRAETFVTIEVTDSYPVKTIALASTKKSLSFDYSTLPATGDIETVYVSVMTDTAENDLLTDETYSYKDKTLSWASSNTRVIKVSECDPYNDAPAASIEAVGTGTATITCKVLDGSGKSAKISLKVVADASKKVKTIKLYESGQESRITSKSIYAGAGSFNITSVSECVDGGVNYLDPIWKNSNSRVVRMEVDADNGSEVILTPLSKGRANITCLAADGSGKKAVLKVTVSQRVEKVTVSGQDYISLGGSGKFTAATLPSNANNKKVIWDFADPKDPDDPEKSAVYDGISINASTGVVKVNKDASITEKIVVRATALDGSEVYGLHSFEVWEKAYKVSAAIASDESIDGINYSKVIATVKKGSYLNTTKIIAKPLNKAGEDIGSFVTFKSSNEKVATVEYADNVAIVTAVGKGSATITAKATDGSGKSSSVKITVLQLTDSITVTGKNTVVRGNKMTCKATVLSKKANNKKVSWHLVDPETGLEIQPEGVTISSSGGVVTVSKTAPVDRGVIGIVAAAKDNGMEFDLNPVKSDIFKLTVSQAKASGVAIRADISTVINAVHDIPEDYDGTSPISSFRLYDTDIPDQGSGREENSITLEKVVTCTENKQEVDLTGQSRVIWSSSNPEVAFVNENAGGNGVVTGVKPGTAVITCMAADGSGKKATAKVTVIKPASGINLTAGAGLYRKGTTPYFVGYGGSAIIEETLATQYGQPTVSGIEWDYEIGVYASGFKKLDDEYKDYYQNNKLFFEFENGRLTANTGTELKTGFERFKKEYPDYTWTNGRPAIRIFIKTTDGTEFEDEEIFYLTEDIEDITTYVGLYTYYDTETKKTVEVYGEGSSSDIVLNGSDKDEDVKRKAYILSNPASRKDPYIQSNGLTTKSAYSSRIYYSIISDDPDVATAYCAYATRDGNTRPCIDIYDHNTGTARLTIKPLDGTDKTAVLTVNVN